MWNKYKIDWTDANAMAGGDWRDLFSILSQAAFERKIPGAATIYMQMVVNDYFVQGAAAYHATVDNIILDSVDERSPYPVEDDENPGHFRHNLWNSVADFMAYYNLGDRLPVPKPNDLISFEWLLQCQRMLMLNKYIGVQAYGSRNDYIMTGADTHTSWDIISRSGTGTGSTAESAYNNAISDAMSKSERINVRYEKRTSVVQSGSLFYANVITSYFKLAWYCPWGFSQVYQVPRYITKRVRIASFPGNGVKLHPIDNAILADLSLKITEPATSGHVYSAIEWLPDGITDIYIDSANLYWLDNGHIFGPTL